MDLNITSLKELIKERNNLKIEVIGKWLWISGKTYEIKESLKELGFLFSSSKRAWFYNGQEYKSNRGFCKDLNEIKEKYSSIEINPLEIEQLKV